MKDTDSTAPTGGFTCPCCQRNAELLVNGICNECAVFQAILRAENEALKAERDELKAGVKELYAMTARLKSTLEGDTNES